MHEQILQSRGRYRTMSIDPPEVRTVYGYPNQNHPSYKKVAAKTWKKAVMKDVKSKGDGQGLCRNAVDHIKNFDNDDPGCKIFFLSQCFVAWEKCFATWSSLSNFLIWSTAFLHRPWSPPFDFTSFSSQSFRSWPQLLLQLGCFWLGFHFF